MNKELSIGINGCSDFSIKLSGCEKELCEAIKYLPLPFYISDNHDAFFSWSISLTIDVLVADWPTRSRLLGVYRAGIDDPFPWHIEKLTSQDGIIWLLDENNDQRALLHINRNTRRIELTQEAANGKWLSRIIKNIFSVVLIDQGWIPLHACAFSMGERAIVCTGERGSGKSTLSILAASMKGAEFLSDDIVFIRPTDLQSEWDIIGWPRRVGIRKALLGEIFEKEKLNNIQSKLRREVLASKIHPRGERLAFDPDELTDLLGVKFTGYVRKKLRIATIGSGGDDVPEIVWELSEHCNSIRATGEDIRYLVDVFGIFTFGDEMKSDVLDPRECIIEKTMFKLPYDVPSVFDHVWPKIIN
ncbi:phosphoenolpyruvate carboxykinase (ATP) [Dickeya dianthicola]|uniref:hypothetical protein n=1 Tax=Dickeya dianthicola TaxID=204039 RepID=UPI0018692E2B|nr:hypothetical protein [Dickeya dianthicola]QOL13591.1 hypothetical protein HGI48_04745 [Dickeya dianthicola]